MQLNSDTQRVKNYLDNTQKHALTLQAIKENDLDFDIMFRSINTLLATTKLEILKEHNYTINWNNVDPILLTEYYSEFWGDLEHLHPEDRLNWDL